MANAVVARGLIPYRYRSGAPYNGAANIYYVPAANATALYIGDPVQILSGSADGNGIPAVQIITAGNGTDSGIGTYGLIGSVVGRVNGGEPIIPITQASNVYLPALTAGYILVADDPFLLFEAQENGNMAGATPTAGSVPGPGKNVDLVAGAGSTVTGYSGWQLGSASLSTSALQMRVLRLLEQADNVLGTNAKWLTSINLHQFTNTTGE
jgi:hypothetical protein